MVLMKAIITSVLVLSLIVVLVASQNEAYAANSPKSQTLNITVYYKGATVAGASCSVVTNANPTPVTGTTNSMGKVTFSLPASATTAYDSCSSNGHNASGTVTLSSTTTNTQLTLK